ncbi:MAG: maleylpyruvate isomerase family mycothiol-dependent enzyme [Actinomycetota bacterium]|nr:maleylpyruvate isomerase family mycothiol-dependent enzyme [Actinomycetota bacterium]
MTDGGGVLHEDEVWRVIDAERAGLADLLDDLSPDEWDTPSLCAGWRVRDVAAHLTLAHMPPTTAVMEMLRARGSFHRMIHDSAVRQAELPAPEFARSLRAMVGSRRKAPGVTPLEPLIDVLVHGQDIAVPLGRRRPVPARSAAVAASRVWTTNWPFRTRARLRGLRLVATDTDCTLGEGADVAGPAGQLLLLVTGRPVAPGTFTGEGAGLLAARLAAPAAG